jgi:hypothetical protein
VVQDWPAHQLDRLLRLVIELVFVRAPMMNFGDGESQMVEFSPAFQDYGAFFFLTYQQGSCWNQ